MTIQKMSASRVFYNVFIATVFRTVYQDEKEPFRTVVARRTFVDKTAFVKHFLNIREQLVIVAPPNFGKSTNLHMLKHFFQIPVNSTGANLTVNMAEKAAYFANLAVCKNHPSICQNHLSSAPVIFLDLDSVNGSTPASFYESFRLEVNRMFRAHGYLAKSQSLPAFDKEEFHAYESATESPARTIGFYKRGIDVLTRLLWNHYKRKCMIFVDNFDRLAVAATLGKDEQYLLPVEVDEIYFSLGKTAKHSTFVARTLLTGVFRMGSHRQWHDENIFYHSIFADPNISQHYGLTVSEVQALLDRMGQSKDQRKDSLEKINYYFDGYSICDKQLKILNTGAVIGYLEGAGANIPSDYARWLPLVRMLKPLFRFELLGEYLDKANEQGLELSPQWVLSVTDLVQLRHAIQTSADDFNGGKNKDLKNLVVQLLQEAGFFSITERLEDGFVRLQIPCSAVRQAYEDLVYHDEFFVTEEEWKKERKANATKNSTRVDSKRGSAKG